MDKGTIVIVGGSRGLGRALASEALKRGYALALVGRKVEDLELAQKELAQEGTAVVTIHAADASNSVELKLAFESIAKNHSRVRGLVNSAATWTGGKTVDEMDLSWMSSSLQLNFMSAFYTIKETLSLWRKQGAGSLAIVNIGATASKRGSPKCSAFAVAKGALRQLSESLAKEMAKEGVHVSHLILDGLIDNERTRRLNPTAKNDQYMNPFSIAKSILNVMEEDKSAWTFEWDMRPFTEKW